MTCPQCGQDKLKAENEHVPITQTEITCTACQYQFSQVEKVKLEQLMVAKRLGCKEY